MATTASFLIVLVTMLGLWGNVSAYFGGESLTPAYYLWSCPEAEAIVFGGVERAVARDPRMAGSLLRLHFHDCFVQGCDASVLLDGDSGEKTAGPNNNSIRGFEVIDSIKAELEFACPGIVSCADILAIAARDSVVLTGGPAWLVHLGRKDSRTPNKTKANENLPSPSSDVLTLIKKFNNVGLTAEDMVTLSGGHTIGNARCSTFSARLQNQPDPTLGKGLLASLQKLCFNAFNNSNPLVNLDLNTPITFDNGYYRNLPSGEGLLKSDQVLYSSGGSTRNLVEYYIQNPEAFFHNFKVSMIKMGNIQPLLGKHGEVRGNCHFPN